MSNKQGKTRVYEMYHRSYLRTQCWDVEDQILALGHLSAEEAMILHSAIVRGLIERTE